MQVTVKEALRSRKVLIQLRSYGFDTPYENTNFHSTRCYLDAAISPRPGPARGRYEERWLPSRSEAIGDILFVPVGMRMRGSCAAGDHRGLSCYFDPSLFEIDFTRLSDQALSETLHLTANPVRGGIARMLREILRPTLATPLALEALAMLVAVDISRWLNRWESGGRRKTGGLSRARLRLIEERLRSATPLPTLSQLAVDCNLSPRHLARAFRQETGQTVGEAVASASADRAMTLLIEGRLAVKEIAGHLGFASASSFSAAFRRATGMRPSDIRNSGLI